MVRGAVYSCFDTPTSPTCKDGIREVSWQIFVFACFFFTFGRNRWTFMSLQCVGESPTHCSDINSLVQLLHYRLFNLSDQSNHVLCVKVIAGCVASTSSAARAVCVFHHNGQSRFLGWTFYLVTSIDKVATDGLVLLASVYSRLICHVIWSLLHVINNYTKIHRNFNNFCHSWNRKY